MMNWNGLIMVKQSYHPNICLEEVKIKGKVSLQQAVKAHGVVTGRGSHIF
jgi:hypothetical protein